MNISFGGQWYVLFLKMEGSVPTEKQRSPTRSLRRALQFWRLTSPGEVLLEPLDADGRRVLANFQGRDGGSIQLLMEDHGIRSLTLDIFPKRQRKSIWRSRFESTWKCGDFEGYWNESYSWAGGTLISIKNQGFFCFQRIVTQIRFKSYVAMIDWMYRGWMWADHQSSGR